MRYTKEELKSWTTEKLAVTKQQLKLDLSKLLSDLSYKRNKEGEEYETVMIAKSRNNKKLLEVAEENHKKAQKEVKELEVAINDCVENTKLVYDELDGRKK